MIFNIYDTSTNNCYRILLTCISALLVWQFEPFIEEKNSLQLRFRKSHCWVSLVEISKAFPIYAR